MDVPQEFLDMIIADIQRLENIDTMNDREHFHLHQEIDGRYQACIANWLTGMNHLYAGTTLRYDRLEDDPHSVFLNLRLMKGKLETYRYQMNAAQSANAPSTQVNVTTNVGITITFDDTRKKIEEMTALSQSETEQILERINQLEAISKENCSRKSKWEKVKPIISYTLDKGADVAIAILSLIVQMKLGI